MKALVYDGGSGTTWTDVPDPRLADPTDVIVEIDTTTICGTDLHILGGHVPEVQAGRVLGHEGVGRVVEAGGDVRRFTVGDRVLLSCITTCGACDQCRAKLGSHCERLDGMGWLFGHLIDGTQAEYVRVPLADTSMYAIPDSVTDEQAVFLSDAIPTGYEIGIHDGGVRPGDVVAVVGAGAVGMAAVLSAGLHGASQLIVIDSNEFRLRKALELGADDALGPGDDVADRVKALTADGLGVDVAIEAVGYPETLQAALAMTRPGGRIANVGVHGSPVEIPMQTLWSQNVTLSTGLVNTWSTPMLLRMVARARLASDAMATHRYPLAEVEKAYEIFADAAAQDCLRVVLSTP